MGAIISVITTEAREADYYRARLARFRSLSHLTVEVFHKSCRPCENNSQSRNNDCETRAVAHFARSGRENRLS
jgi:hypothetical protein